MFLFRLALALGKTVGELEASLSQRELMEWVDYYAIDPFGSFRTDIQTGILGTVIAQVIGGNKRARPSHFMPLQRETAATAPADPQALARQAFGAFMLAMGRHKLRRLGRKARGAHGVAR